MNPGKGVQCARNVCEDGGGDQSPAELYQAPHLAPSRRSKRFRTRACKRSEILRHTGSNNEQSEKALDMEFLRQEADLDNMLQLNERLLRAEAATHRDMLCVVDRIAKYQADCKRVEAQTLYLQQRINKLTALGMHGPVLDGEDAEADADDCSEASSTQSLDEPLSELKLL